MGDVVLFNQDFDGQRYVYVWRVIALPGDKVVVEEKEVSINGQTLTHEFLEQVGELKIYTESQRGKSYRVAYDSSASEDNRRGTSVIVPEGYLFMLGDNRFNAMDSRYYGPVDFEAVIGKMQF